MAGNQPLRLTQIDYLGALRVRGADAARFLQGQVSNDVVALPVGRAQLAGYHTPQGRALALLRLLRLAEDDVLAVLPRELAAPLAGRLRKYVLRAKVQVDDASSQWIARGIAGTAPPESGALLSPQLHDVRVAGPHVATCIGTDPQRWLVLSAPGEPPEVAAACGPCEPDEWRALDIAAGLPQVYAATSEAFVAQMLNLDVLGGIAFDKGCYTGQEVIARAHYRGRVKRRMQRFRTLGAAQFVPGDAGTMGDGRAFRVVESIVRADGRCEFLAVAPFGAETGGDETPAAAGGSIDCEALPLPYALPD